MGWKSFKMSRGGGFQKKLKCYGVGGSDESSTEDYLNLNVMGREGHQKSNVIFKWNRAYFQCLYCTICRIHIFSLINLWCETLMVVVVCYQTLPPAYQNQAMSVTIPMQNSGYPGRQPQQNQVSSTTLMPPQAMQQGNLSPRPSSTGIYHIHISTHIIIHVSPSLSHKVHSH